MKQKERESNRKKYEKLLKQKDDADFTNQLELERTKIDNRLGQAGELHSMVKAKLELLRRVTLKKIDLKRRQGFLHIEENAFEDKVEGVKKARKKFNINV